MLDGWKTPLGALLLNIPFFGQNPLLLDAVQGVFANPKDLAAYYKLLANIVLVVGAVHATKKNLLDQ